MKIKLIGMGNKMSSWVQSGYQEYAKRMPNNMSLELIELPLTNRGKNTSIEQAKTAEAEQILAAIAPQDYVIALDVKGKSWSTEQLAEQMQDWRMSGQNICLLIGGPNGLDDTCLARAQQRWSLSALTLPHPLVRVFLAEQLYRAWTIIQGHPYHK